MTLVIADRVREYSTTTGTGAYTLDGAQAGFQSFAAVGDGNTCEYCCTNGDDWEVGLGTYAAAGTTLARTQIYASSNSDAEVSWGSGTRDIFLTMPAEGWARALPTDITTGNTTITGTISVAGHATFEGVTSTGATGTGKIVFDASPTLTGHPTIEGVTATGATGTGKLVFDTSPTISGHPTVEGVTATGATGTGKLVFDTSPTISGHPTVEGVTATGATGTGNLVFDSTPTLSTPVFTGLPTGTGVASAATASTLVARDADANLKSNANVPNFATTATAAGTTTLVVGSAQVQEFTGATTQIVALPVTSTLTTGHAYTVINNSTGLVTVNSSGGNEVKIVSPGTTVVITCILVTGTTAASWSAASVASGQMLGNSAAKGIFWNAQTIAEDLTLAATQNGFSVGPISVSGGYTVTLEGGARWLIL